MLNEELKIKIIQYLDGELDQGAENEIEEILDSNEEANDFCNQMKSLNINLKEFAHTSEYQAYSKKADALIDTVVDKHLGSKKKSNTFSFRDFLTPQNITGYALTAALCLTVGIVYDESDNLNLNSNIFELDQTTFERNVFKKRNMTQDENIKDILKSTIQVYNIKFKYIEQQWKEFINNIRFLNDVIIKELSKPQVIWLEDLDHAWLEKRFHVTLKKTVTPFYTTDYEKYFNPEDMAIIKEKFKERFENEFQFYGYEYK